MAVVLVVLIGGGCSGGSSQPTATITTLATVQATAAPTTAASSDGGAYLRAFSAAYAEVLVVIRGTTPILQANFDPNDAGKVAQLRAQFTMFKDQYRNVQALSPPPELAELHQAALQEMSDYSSYVTNFEAFLDTGDKGKLATASVYLKKAGDDARQVGDLLRRANLPIPLPPTP